MKQLHLKLIKSLQRDRISKKQLDISKKVLRVSETLDTTGEQCVSSLETSDMHASTKKKHMIINHQTN